MTRKQRFAAEVRRIMAEQGIGTREAVKQAATGLLARETPTVDLPSSFPAPGEVHGRFVRAAYRHAYAQTGEKRKPNAYAAQIERASHVNPVKARG